MRVKIDCNKLLCVCAAAWAQGSARSQWKSSASQWAMKRSGRSCSASSAIWDSGMPATRPRPCASPVNAASPAEERQVLCVLIYVIRLNPSETLKERFYLGITTMFCHSR